MATKKKMTEEDKRLFDMICQRFKNDIMKYDENQSLPRYLILRIKGVAEGKHIANNLIEDKANYGFDVVLNAMKASKPAIDYAIKTVNFENEQHKINYIMKIIEGNLNDVYKGMQRVKESAMNAERVDTEKILGAVIEYNPNEDNQKKKSRVAKDIW